MRAPKLSPQLMGHVLNLGIFALLIATIGANIVIRQPITVPNVEYFPDMARGPGFGTYEPNPNFPDGKTLQAPVVGTIARGFPPLGYGPNGADNLRAGAELTNPFSLNDKAALERGTVVFERYCVPCHGPKGAGDGLVVEHGFRRPPNLTRAFTRQMKDGQLFHLATFGRGAMPAHGSQIPANDRWKAVLHLRVLQGVTTDQAPATPRAAAPAAAASGE